MWEWKSDEKNSQKVYAETDLKSVGGIKDGIDEILPVAWGCLRRSIS